MSIVSTYSTILKFLTYDACSYTPNVATCISHAYMKPLSVLFRDQAARILIIKHSKNTLVKISWLYSILFALLT